MNYIPASQHPGQQLCAQRHPKTPAMFCRKRATAPSVDSNRCSWPPLDLHVPPDSASVCGPLANSQSRELFIPQILFAHSHGPPYSPGPLQKAEEVKSVLLCSILLETESFPGELSGLSSQGDQKQAVGPQHHAGQDPPVPMLLLSHEVPLKGTCSLPSSW